MARKVVLPSKVRITGKVSYEVIYCDDLGKDTLAECRSAPLKQIALRNNLSNKELIKSFLHEVLHCIEFEYNISIPHKTIHDMEEGIYKILKLNGWLKR